MLLWLNGHKKEEEIPLICGMEATGVYYEECAFFFDLKPVSRLR